MEKNDEKKPEITTKKRISTSERKVKTFFKSLDSEKRKFLEPAIHQLAVLQVTLERLADEISDGDILEDFEQGTQKFKRENPALKAYNATIKSYTTLNKQLIDMLPNTEAGIAGKALMSFIAPPQTGAK